MNWTLIWILVGAVAVIVVGYIALMAVLDRFQHKKRATDPREEEHLDHEGTVGEVTRHPGESARHHEDVDEVLREPHDE